MRRSLPFLAIATGLLVAVVLLVLRDDGGPPQEAPDRDVTSETEQPAITPPVIEPGGPPQNEPAATGPAAAASPAPTVPTTPTEEEAAERYFRLVGGPKQAPLANLEVEVDGKSLVTDAFGRVRRRSRAEERKARRGWSAVIRAKGYATEHITYSGRRSALELVLDVRLFERARLEGYLLDYDGRPLAGVGIHLRRNPEFPPVFYSHNNIRVRNGDCHYTIKTDASGKFVFDDLPSRVPFRCWFHARETHKARMIAALQPGENRVVRWEMEPTAVIAGRVVDPRGEPVACRVKAVRLRDDGRVELRQTGFPHARRFADTKASGAFRLTEVPLGTYRIVASPDEEHEETYGAAEALLKLTVPGAVTTCVIRLRDDLTIRGTVVDPAGTLVDAWVTAWPTGRWKHFSEGVSVSVKSGRFTLRALQDDVYRLYATGKGLAPSRIQSVKAGADEIRLTLRRAHRLRGTVRAEGAEVFPLCEVTLTEKGSSRALDVTHSEQSDGSFDFAEVGAGAYRLLIDDSEWFAEPADVRVHDDGSHAPIVLRLEPAGTLEIRTPLLEGTGNPGTLRVVRGQKTVHQLELATRSKKVKVRVGNVSLVFERDGQRLMKQVGITAGETTRVTFP